MEDTNEEHQGRAKVSKTIVKESGHIQPLSSSDALRIRASLRFPTISSILLAFLRNSLTSSGVSSVRIDIDLEPEWQIRCQDNGAGFDPISWSKQAFSSEQPFSDGYPPSKDCFAQSKSHSSLQLLAYLGALDISSNTCAKRETARSIVKDDTIIHHSTSTSPLDDIVFPLKTGCCITLRDVFSNLPVRRHLFSTASSARSEIDDCRQIVAFEALKKPSIRIELYVSRYGDQRFSLQIPKAVDLLSRYETIFEIPVTSTDYARPTSETFRLVPQGNERACVSIKVDGFILKEHIASRAHQHLLIGDYYLPGPSSGLGWEPYNSGLELSQYLAELCHVFDIRASRRLRNRVTSFTEEAVAHDGSPKKAYHLPGAHLKNIHETLQYTIEAMMQSEGSKHSDYNSKPHGIWTTSGRKLAYGYFLRASFEVSECQSSRDTYPLSPGGILRTLQDSVRKTLGKRNVLLSSPLQSPTVYRKRRRSEEGKEPRPSRTRRERPISCALDRKDLRMDPAVRVERDCPLWFENVFGFQMLGGSTSMTEEETSRVKDDCEVSGSHPPLSFAKRALRNTYPRRKVSRFFKEDIRGIALEKEHLRSASLISQVDCKFLACKMSRGHDTSNEPVLVLIDQHAADERVRVERMYSEYVRECESDNLSGRILPQPVLVALSKDLAKYFYNDELQYNLRYWGFDISLVSENNAHVEVRSVPHIVKERMHWQPSIIPQLVKDLAIWIEGGANAHLRKGELTKREEAKESHNLSRGATHATWVTALRRMPTPMMELITSKACRGAVMFNDAMSDEQCENLVGQLSETTFPFQCAHGRPSLVPLCTLGPPVGQKRPRINWAALSQIH